MPQPRPRRIATPIRFLHSCTSCTIRSRRVESIAPPTTRPLRRLTPSAIFRIRLRESRGVARVALWFAVIQEVIMNALAAIGTS